MASRKTRTKSSGFYARGGKKFVAPAKRSQSLCPNGCGERGPHFVPPSLGEPGFYTCQPKGGS